MKHKEKPISIKALTTAITCVNDHFNCRFHGAVGMRRHGKSENLVLKALN